MILTQKQNQVAKSRIRFRVLCFGRGTGKTHLALEEGIGVAVAKKGRKVAYFATTIQQARDVAWERLKERVQPIIVSTNESRLEVTIKTQDGGTSVILLRGWEAIETMRGQELDFIIIDEVAFMRGFWNGWEKVLRPTLRISEGGAMFISTPNGFNHFHDLYKMGLDATNEFFESFHATAYDNPHVSKEETDVAKATLPEDTFAQEYMADFRRVEGLVYKEFEAYRHTLKELPTRVSENGNKYGILDFGFKNPSAMYTIYEYDKDYYVTDEMYETGKLHPELADLAASRGVKVWYPDPADAEGCEQLRRKGLQVKEVSKDVVAGISSVKNCFKQNRLFIVNCPQLESELNFYRWQEKGNSKIDMSEPEKPVKEYDHAMDALRYGVHMLETRKVSNINLDAYYRDLEDEAEYKGVVT